MLCTQRNSILNFCQAGYILLMTSNSVAACATSGQHVLLHPTMHSMQKQFHTFVLRADVYD